MAASMAGTTRIGTCFTKVLSLKRQTTVSCHPYFLCGMRQQISTYHIEGIHNLCLRNCESALNSRENKKIHHRNFIGNHVNIRKYSNEPPATSCTPSTSTNPTKLPEIKVAFQDKLKDGPSLQDFIISNVDDNVSSPAIHGEDFSTADSVPYLEANSFEARNRKGLF